MQQATLRKTQAETDHIYITDTVTLPEEIAASRFGEGGYSTETVLDFDLRREMEQVAEETPAPPIQEQQPGQPGQAPLPNAEPQSNQSEKPAQSI